MKKIDTFWKNLNLEIFSLTPNQDISATIGPNDMGGSAFESSWCIFFENKKNFLSFLISLWILVQLRKFQKISSSCLNPSSIAIEIKGGWGRIEENEIFWKYDALRFERTSSHVFSTNSRWNISILILLPGGSNTGNP